jgi:hypothetical protein
VERKTKTYRNIPSLCPLPRGVQFVLQQISFIQKEGLLIWTSEKKYGQSQSLDAFHLGNCVESL